MCHRGQPCLHHSCKGLFRESRTRESKRNPEDRKDQAPSPGTTRATQLRAEMLLLLLLLRLLLLLLLFLLLLLRLLLLLFKT